MDNMVTPATRAVCHDSNDPATCFQTGIAFSPEAISSRFSLRAADIESASIGKLLEIARKKVFALIAKEGNSLATCWTDIFRELNLGVTLFVEFSNASEAVAASFPRLWYCLFRLSTTLEPFLMLPTDELETADNRPEMPSKLPATWSADCLTTCNSLSTVLTTPEAWFRI